MDLQRDPQMDPQKSLKWTPQTTPKWIPKRIPKWTQSPPALLLHNREYFYILLKSKMIDCFFIYKYSPQWTPKMDPQMDPQMDPLKSLK